jgi:flagellar biosynthesis GTPase FlhF
VPSGDSPDGMEQPLIRERNAPLSISLVPVGGSPTRAGESPALPTRTTNRFAMPEPRTGEWRSAALLGTMGISAVNTERVLDRLKHQHGEQPPASLRAELALTRAALAGFWKSKKSAVSGLHVFIGAPGCGKTTAICKWLTQAVLLDGASARVWRVDVPRANTAEALSVHCEILNVPVERSWNPGATWQEDHLFIDLPGVEAGDETALTELNKMLSTMPGASVSLVLNAAYDLPLLQAQVRAFGRLPLTNLIFTHLDEEPRWSKLWNFVLGTNYSLSFLSAGQNIPGQFLRATPEALFPEEMRGS